MTSPSPIELVLDFCVDIARRMIVSGANLERVHLALERILHAYDLSDVSIFLLSTQVSVSGRDEAGVYASRQASIPPAGIHLQRLKQLNRLCYTVSASQPAPSRLQSLLQQADSVREYPDWVILLARMAAMVCLCLIFGGGLREALCVVAVTALMHYVMRLLARPGLDSIVVNALTMFIATCAVLLLITLGASDQAPVILITVSMLVIPGIPLVNAVRNLLCGNEMNGILQMAKVTIETLALAMGIYVSLWVFGHGSAMDNAVVAAMSDPVPLLILSFAASVSFGVVFRIPPHDLLRAGIGGLLTRVALILLTPLIPARITLISLSALVASLYAELMATRRRDPSTYFVYPAIVPLIPGDLFYYAIVGLYTVNTDLLAQSSLNCALTLLGMSIGFVLSSIIAHYIRRMRHRRAVLSAAQRRRA